MSPSSFEAEREEPEVKPLARKITIMRMETPPSAEDDKDQTKWPTWEPRWKKSEDLSKQTKELTSDRNNELMPQDDECIDQVV